MTTREQGGFTAIEGLLLVVIASLIGFTGWYVWHSKNNADKSYISTSNASMAASAKTRAQKKPAIPTNFQDCVKENTAVIDTKDPNGLVCWVSLTSKYY